MTVIGGGILTVLAIAIAFVDWFASPPKPGAPVWPRWVKLICTSSIALLGLAAIFEGYYKRGLGVEAYKDGDYRQSIELLDTTINSPFKNREALDYLALAWKKQAETATLPRVQQSNYLTSINLMVQSITEYPCSPKAHNNLVNILRRTKRWQEGKHAINQLIDKLEGGDFSLCVPKVQDKELATYYVTLGNFYIDDANPEYSIETAMMHYGRAEKIDPSNRFLILNLPPRLLLSAELSPDPERKRQLLKRSYQLSRTAIKLREQEDQIFALINIVDTLSETLTPPLVADNDSELKKYAIELERRRKSANVDDETWLVLAKANLFLCDFKSAKKNLRMASAVKNTYTNRQMKALAKLETSVTEGSCSR